MKYTQRLDRADDSHLEKMKSRSWLSQANGTSSLSCNTRPSEVTLVENTLCFTSGNVTARIQDKDPFHF